MENINDYSRYIQLMRNGFYDKLFFLDKLFHKWNSLIDYGCAEGFQTKLIAQVFPDKQITGYDNDQTMVNLARYSGSLSSNVRFTQDEADCYQGDIINLGSVIHEVYSYRHPEKIKDFWAMVFNPNRKYVIIRDMLQHPYYEGYSDDVVQAIKDYCKKLHVLGELKRFEDHWLPLNNDRTIIHFLMKLPYITSPNWPRELHENYVPLSAENMFSQAPEGWCIEYVNRYTLPFLKYWWKQNLGVDAGYHTHINVIFRNKTIYNEK